ncbi:MAG: hypothetical protein AAGH83_09065, partial [Pseudomonadota bacterium]
MNYRIGEEMEFAREGTAVVTALFVLSACAVPNVSNQVADLQMSVTDASEPLVSQLQSEIERDTRAARNRAIAARSPVYDRAFDCLEAAGGSLNIPISNCRLDSAFQVPDG